MNLKKTRDSQVKIEEFPHYVKYRQYTCQIGFIFTCYSIGLSIALRPKVDRIICQRCDSTAIVAASVFGLCTHINYTVRS